MVFNMRRLITYILLLVLMPGGPAAVHLCGQSSLSDGSLKSLELLPGPDIEEPELRGVLILRISERYLKELFARNIDKRSPVTRIVLGTLASGTSHTTGRVEVVTESDRQDAAFYVQIFGCTNARTIGRNGPAVIYSLSITRWTAEKFVRFDGTEFTTGPAILSSDTRIVPLGAGSSLPGLRGRVVSRIATRKAVELNSIAERITAKDTDKRILEDVNRVIDGQVGKLNERIESQPWLRVLLLRLEDIGVNISTSSNCINISFSGKDSDSFARACPVQGREPSDTEIWFQTALVAEPDGELPKLIKGSGSYLARLFPGLEIPSLALSGENGMLPFQLEVVEDWIVVRSQNLIDAAAQD
jgi:hypothetical protein